MLGENTKLRFRPSYFPFTEPSMKLMYHAFKCGGKGCNLCKQTGWIEFLGAGMVHPNVLKMNGYNPEKYTGFAFGTGLDRLAMFVCKVNVGKEVLQIVCGAPNVRKGLKVIVALNGAVLPEIEIKNQQ